MAPGPAKKSNEDFWDEALGFFIGWGKRLKDIGGTSDLYNDHSVIKLVAMTYWVGIFVPIVKRNLVEKFGYRMVYIDTMGGTGVTETKRKHDHFVGSCPAALLSAEGRGCAFSGIVAVERDAKKAAALKKRLAAVSPEAKVLVIDRDIADVSTQLNEWFKNKVTSFCFVDPQGFEGMTWDGIKPVLELKGDVMITWFEGDAFRLKEAALSAGNSAKGDRKRMDDLFGLGAWESARSGEELTRTFCRRVQEGCGKLPAVIFPVADSEKGHYKLLLLAGKGCPPELPGRWLEQMTRRAPDGTDIAMLVDHKVGRAKKLDDFL